MSFRAVVRRNGFVGALYVSRPMDTEEEARVKGTTYLRSVYGDTMKDNLLQSGQATVTVYPADSVHHITGEPKNDAVTGASE